MSRTSSLEKVMEVDTQSHAWCQVQISKIKDGLQDSDGACREACAATLAAVLQAGIETAGGSWDGEDNPLLQLIFASLYHQSREAQAMACLALGKVKCSQSLVEFNGMSKGRRKHREGDSSLSTSSRAGICLPDQAEP